MADQIVTDPTYLEHVRHFFDEVDLDHMAALGVDLSTYALLTARANDVYLHTLQPDGDMPPEPDRRWSAKRSATFLNWITNGMPIGVPTPAAPQPSTAGRIRKDARDLTEDEITLLARAFQGLIDRSPDHPQSYFALAGTHWYPPPNECKHHNDLYQPWHRVFVSRFEDALRSVEGCEDVTLPYWDITAAPPDFLFTAPFDSYTAPRDIFAPEYPAGYGTVRFDAKTIAQNCRNFGVAETIADAMTTFRWKDFNTRIWEAHDAGHPACGESMSVPDVASFDPIFWFFHANWDRLWHLWQQAMQATTYWTFRSTIFGSPAFLQPPLNTLAPFTGDTADKTVDLDARGVGYAIRADEPPVAMRFVAAGAGSLAAGPRVKVQDGPLVSLRLKGIDRMAIPGTFRVLIKADGATLAQRFFFQSTEPRACANCSDNPTVDLDFLVEADAVRGKALTADVQVLSRTDPREATPLPMRVCGNPTINVRLLLEEAL